MRSALSRRGFLRHTTAGLMVAAAHRATAGWFTRPPEPTGRFTATLQDLAFTPAPLSRDDRVIVPEGFAVEVLVKQGDRLNARGETYGDHNDYLAILPEGEDAAWLWVNHEGVTLPVVTGAWTPKLSETQAAVYLENMGGSAMRLRRTEEGRWTPVVPHRRNFRLNGLDSTLRLTGPAAGTPWVHGARRVTGSTSNCGGGITPWGTVCSGEENYQEIWGDAEIKETPLIELPSRFHRPGEHFGYIVEIDPGERRFWKHTALGHFSHENIAFTLTREGRVAAYMGDDRDDQCVYKFISRERFRPALGKRNRRLLEDGTLYVADTLAGRWRPLDPAADVRLRNAGFDAARVCVHTRTAAKIVGGTPLPRPEDVEVNPETGEVFVALTSWERHATTHTEKYFASMAGALARLREAGGDAGALEFEWQILLPGSRDTGMVWPDNLTWADPERLLVTTDFSQKPSKDPAQDASSPRTLLGNNYLVVVATHGPRAGEVRRLAVAPRAAEFCSPILTPGADELWVNVQHPGDSTTSPDAWTSHWPDGGDALPRSALVAIRPRA